MKISDLLGATSLAGTENVVLVQDGKTRRAAISSLVGAAASPYLNTAAESAAEAVAAAEAAMATPTIYPDTATGLADTALGRFFFTPADEEGEFLILWRHSPDGADEISRSPSVAMGDLLRDARLAAIDAANRAGAAADAAERYTIWDENGVPIRTNIALKTDLDSPSGAGMVRMANGNTAEAEINAVKVLASSVVNVLSYGILANTGMIDAGPIITAAHDHLPAKGGTIVFPAGFKYRLDSKPVLSKSVHLQFEGGLDSGSVLEVNFPTDDVFHLDGRVVRISGLHMRSAVPRSSGAFFNMQNCPMTFVESCRIEGAYIGFEVNGGSLTRIRDVIFRNFSSHALAPGGALVWVGRSVQTVDFQMSGCVADNDNGDAQQTYGVVLQYADAPIIWGNDVIHCGTNLAIIPGAGQFVSAAKIFGNYWDTAHTGVLIAPALGGICLRLRFYDNWTCSHTNYGIRIAGAGIVTATHISHNQAILNGDDGISVANNSCTDTVILHPTGAQNGGSAISIGDNIRQFYIRTPHIGDVDGQAGNLIGIYIGTGCTEYEITDGMCKGNIAADYSDSSLAGIVRNVTGIPTKKRGKTFIPSGGVSRVVTHHLAVPPRLEDILLSPTSSWAAGYPYVASIGTDTFTVVCDAPAGADVGFVWRAECLQEAA